MKEIVPENQTDPTPPLNSGGAQSRNRQPCALAFTHRLCGSYFGMFGFPLISLSGSGQHVTAAL